MATAASPMASQLKSSFASSLARRLVIPTAISGAPFRVSPSKRSFTVKAIQSEKVTNSVFLACLPFLMTMSSVPLLFRQAHKKS